MCNHGYTFTASCYISHQDYPNMSRIYRWLIGCGAVAPFVLVGCIVIGAAITPGYNHVSEPISQLSATGSSHPAWMITGFIAYGLLVTVFGLVLSRSISRHRLAWLVLILFTLHGIGFCLGGICRDDPRTMESIVSGMGILHNVFIIIGCFSFVGGMFVFAWVACRDQKWRRFAKWIIGTLVIILLTFVISQIPIFASIEGILQRTYGILSLIIIELVSIKLLVHGNPASG